ncbi:hypothetical protein [Bradyrhizobium sp. AZCC 2289]|uniref:hypothetical protein n=1 Tax=Bradyrhizobium sp. AZCC 2289 TaxID=3117026 RepID=UPI002FEF8D07
MRGLRKITNFSILTVSTEPLRGIVEIDTFDSVVKFELSEDTALNICADLEHFLTQGSPGDHASHSADRPRPDIGTNCYVRSRHS